jgi:hypothetical protein
MPTISPDLAITPANLPTPLGFAPRSLNRDEDPASYETLIARMTDTVRPADLIEEIWLRDVVEHVWETIRLRRRKAGLMNANAGEGLRDILSALDCQDYFTLSKRWFARDPEVVAGVEAELAAAGLGISDVMAQTLRRHLADYDGMDRMLRSAEARRDAALHEIERHRAHFADLLRRAAQAEESAAEKAAGTGGAPIEDAEFVVVQTGRYPEAAG